ncbi:hypothetical protein [Bradyrhizobium sp. USDA 4452]
MADDWSPDLIKSYGGIERAKALADKIERAPYAVGIAFSYNEFRLVIDALRRPSSAPVDFREEMIERLLSQATSNDHIFARAAALIKLDDEVIEQQRADYEVLGESYFKVREECERLKALTERAIKGIRDFTEGNYDNPRQHRPATCKHDQYWYQGCQSCDEAYMEALVSSLLPEGDRG